jgi:hypothetical protein
LDKEAYAKYLFSVLEYDRTDKGIYYEYDENEEEADQREADQREADQRDADDQRRPEDDQRRPHDDQSVDGPVDSDSEGSVRSTGSTLLSVESLTTFEPVETVYTADEALMYVTELIMKIRAGLRGNRKEDVGRPTRVTETEAIPRFKWGDAGLAATTSVRVDFAIARNMRRVCPISKETQTTNFHALLHADDRTGLLAVYVHCPSCAAKEPVGSRIIGGYCFVGFIGEDNERLLRRSGVFEKAKARIDKLNEDMKKITWQCVKCDEWLTEGEKPSMECCSDHLMNDEWVCEDCRNCRTPCERWKPPEDYYW